jgi:hypothetical protein
VLDQRKGPFPARAQGLTDSEPIGRWSHQLLKFCCCAERFSDAAVQERPRPQMATATEIRPIHGTRPTSRRNGVTTLREAKGRWLGRSGLRGAGEAIRPGLEGRLGAYRFWPARTRRLRHRARGVRTVGIGVELGICSEFPLGAPALPQREECWRIWLGQNSALAHPAVRASDRAMRVIDVAVTTP